MGYDRDHLLKRYVRPDQPFGPAEATDVEEPICAAALYDWNNKIFAEMLSGSDVLVGRRGSGKSSLLKSFPARRFLLDEFESDEGRDFRYRHHISAKILSTTPDLIVEVDTPAQVDQLEGYCVTQPVIPSVEMLARLWNRQIWLLVGKKIDSVDGSLWTRLPDAVRRYIRGKDIEETVLSISAAEGALSSSDFISQLEQFLEENGLHVVVTFDNIERHKFEPPQDAVLGGLIAATGKFIRKRHPSLDVKLCLPAELFRQLETITFRPDKDMHRVQYLHWNAAEMLHLAARRLRLYLSLWDEEGYDLIKDKRITDRKSLIEFWMRYLPSTIVNSVGLREETITYILRHTQMLPRQLISTLNNICGRFRGNGDSLFHRPFDEQEVIKGIEDTEKANIGAVLFMFERLFPEVRNMFAVVMPRLMREFDYGHLQSVWHSSARSYMERMGKMEFLDFWQLMLSTGAIGVGVDEKRSEVYTTARFEFNTKHALAISDKDRLCVHPMFSRIYNVLQLENSRVVLPRGSDFEIDRDRI